MGKQYISTNTVCPAHSLDVLDVAVTRQHTVTVSSDGQAKFWANDVKENDDPNDHVHSQLIDASGVHHVNVYENTLQVEGKYKSVVVVAYGTFSGAIKVDHYVENYASIKSIDVPAELQKNSWIPIFYKDPENTQDYMIVTKIDGSIILYKINVTEEGVELEKQCENSSESSFPISIDISVTEDKKLAVGYTNGDVYLYSLENLKMIYTFRSTDLQVSSKEQTSNSIPRVVKFSPGGSILAVARDNQNAGSLTIYDVKYGENVGSLTTPSHSSKTEIGGFAHEGWIMGLSFDYEGKFLASCGFDKCVRVWNLENKEREATIQLSISDFDSPEAEEQDVSIASAVSFIRKGVRGGAGGGSNDGLCVVSFDKGVRWYREAGGI